MEIYITKGSKVMFKKLKKTFKKYLEDMAKENQKLYGKERMDCCNLNKSKKG